MSTMTDKLDPGIRELVLRLREHGFRTTDSGDGSKFGTTEGALPFPHVVMVAHPETLVLETDRLHYWRDKLGIEDPSWEIVATYTPADEIATISLSNPNVVSEAFKAYQIAEITANNYLFKQITIRTMFDLESDINCGLHNSKWCAIVFMYTEDRKGHQIPSEFKIVLTLRKNWNPERLNNYEIEG